MAAPSETYVDPSIAGNSGTGTSGDPYGDLQYALDTMTRDTTNGDRINVQDSAAEVLTAALSLATYGNPTQGAPLIFQGYTTTAGDGGIGEVSGNGSYSIISDTVNDYVGFVDMELHNSGSATIVQGDNSWFLYNCEIHNTTGTGFDGDDENVITNCYFHNIGGDGVHARHYCLVNNSHFENGTNDFSDAVDLADGVVGRVQNCSFDLDGASNGIRVSGRQTRVTNNSLYSNGGTGTGIIVTGTDGIGICVQNNLIEGFSGVGGVGVNLGLDSILFGPNSFFNNSTDVSGSGDQLIDFGDNSLSASPFIDAANDNFTVKTSVVALAFPTDNFPGGNTIRTWLDKGALQRKSFPLVHPGYGGGLG